MKDDETAVQSSTSGIGAAMFVSWLLFLGPVGLVLLLGLPYAMIVQDLAFGIVCGLLLIIPVGTNSGVDSGCLLRSSQGKEDAIDGTEFGVCAGTSQCRLNLRSVVETGQILSGYVVAMKGRVIQLSFFYYL